MKDKHKAKEDKDENEELGWLNFLLNKNCAKKYTTQLVFKQLLCKKLQNPVG